MHVDSDMDVFVELVITARRVRRLTTTGLQLVYDTITRELHTYFGAGTAQMHVIRELFTPLQHCTSGSGTMFSTHICPT